MSDKTELDRFKENVGNAVDNPIDAGMSASFMLVGYAALAAVALPVAAVVVTGWGLGKAFAWLNRPKPPPHIPTKELEKAARQVELPDTDTLIKLAFRAQAELGLLPHTAFASELREAMEQAYQAYRPRLPTVSQHADEIGIARYRDALRKYAEFDPSVIPNTFATVLRRLTSALPPIALQTPAEFAGEEMPSRLFVSLIDTLPNAGEVVEAIILPFYGEGMAGFFTEMKEEFDRNLCEMSRLPYEPASLSSHKLVMPTKYEGSPRECLFGYLKNTPFGNIFSVPLPLNLPSEVWRTHGYVLGHSGSGKTQLLQTLILDFLKEPDPPSLIIIDSQGDMLGKIERLAGIQDRLIIIDPEDDAPPALNMFDMETPRLHAYSRNVREQVEAGVIELYNYLFGALDSQLTSKQSTAFSFVARLMLSMPGATIHTFRRIMEAKDTTEFDPHIAKLDTTAREFFERQFFTKAFGDTREQVARRLYDFLRVPAFDRIFSAPKNTLDMFEAMQSGKVVLVNTSKALLKGASGLFGRYMIMQVLAATYERVAVPEHQRKQAFLIVDEAHEYFDKSIEDMLTQARKFRVGVIAAHQSLDQAGDIRSALIANTGVKLVGGVSDRDARALAPDMRVSADLIMGISNIPEVAEFICYIRNTPRAAKLAFPFGLLEDEPTISIEEHRLLRATNRATYAYRPPIQIGADPGNPPPPQSPTIDPSW